MGVQSLGRYAFMYCESLKSVEIPASVEIVGDYAFYFADSLETLTFAPGSGVQSLGKRAFGFCDSLKSVEIPASVEIVGDFTFFKAINLASVTFAAGSLIQSLGQYAFSGTSIETIILPDGLRDLGDNVFQLVTAFEILFSQIVLHQRKLEPIISKIPVLRTCKHWTTSFRLKLNRPTSLYALVFKWRTYSNALP